MRNYMMYREPYFNVDEHVGNIETGRFRLLVGNFRMDEFNVALVNTGKKSAAMDMIGCNILWNLPVAARVTFLNIFRYKFGNCSVLIYSGMNGVLYQFLH